MPAHIAICGSNTFESSHKSIILSIAEQCGELIAKNNCLLLCGGHGGVMAAACKGVKHAGGTSIGILPEESKEYANAFVTHSLPTGLGIKRNSLLVDCADVVIAICGGWGTLNEISYAVNIGKPVVLVKGTGGIVDHIIDESFPLSKDGVFIEDCAKDAVETALRIV